MFHIQYQVPKELIDPSYHHVHHSAIVSIFEKARLELLLAAKIPLETLVERGQFLVVSAISVEYLREVRQESYTVTCDSLTPKSSKRFLIGQRILNASGKIAARATVECCFIIGGRGAEPPHEFVETLRQVIDQARAVD